jgi:dTDP-glucose 4,6-dehydratase
VGGGNERSNLSVAEAICDLLDERQPLGSGQSRRSLIQCVADRPGHDRRYAIDGSRISTELGWSATRNFEAGLAETVDWYLANDWWWRPLRERYAGERLGAGV